MEEKRKCDVSKDSTVNDEELSLVQAFFLKKRFDLSSDRNRKHERPHDFNREFSHSNCHTLHSANTSGANVTVQKNIMEEKRQCDASKDSTINNEELSCVHALIQQKRLERNLKNKQPHDFNREISHTDSHTLHSTNTSGAHDTVQQNIMEEKRKCDVSKDSTVNDEELSRVQAFFRKKRLNLSSDRNRKHERPHDFNREISHTDSHTLHSTNTSGAPVTVQQNIMDEKRKYDVSKDHTFNNQEFSHVNASSLRRRFDLSSDRNRKHEQPYDFNREIFHTDSHTLHSTNTSGAPVTVQQNIMDEKRKYDVSKDHTFNNQEFSHVNASSLRRRFDLSSDRNRKHEQPYDFNREIFHTDSHTLHSTNTSGAPVTVQQNIMDEKRKYDVSKDHTFNNQEFSHVNASSLRRRFDLSSDRNRKHEQPYDFNREISHTDSHTLHSTNTSGAPVTVQQNIMDEKRKYDVSKDHTFNNQEFSHVNASSLRRRFDLSSDRNRKHEQPYDFNREIFHTDSHTLHSTNTSGAPVTVQQNIMDEKRKYDVSKDHTFNNQEFSHVNASSLRRRFDLSSDRNRKHEQPYDFNREISHTDSHTLHSTNTSGAPVTVQQNIMDEKRKYDVSKDHTFNNQEFSHVNASSLRRRFDLSSDRNRKHEQPYDFNREISHTDSHTLHSTNTSGAPVTVQQNIMDEKRKYDVSKDHTFNNQEFSHVNASSLRRRFDLSSDRNRKHEQPYDFNREIFHTDSHTLHSTNTSGAPVTVQQNIMDEKRKYDVSKDHTFNNQEFSHVNASSLRRRFDLSSDRNRKHEQPYDFNREISHTDSHTLHSTNTSGAPVTVQQNIMDEKRKYDVSKDHTFNNQEFSHVNASSLRRRFDLSSDRNRKHEQPYDFNREISHTDSHTLHSTNTSGAPVTVQQNIMDEKRKYDVSKDHTFNNQEFSHVNASSLRRRFDLSSDRNRKHEQPYDFNREISHTDSHTLHSTNTSGAPVTVQQNIMDEKRKYDVSKDHTFNNQEFSHVNASSLRRRFDLSSDRNRKHEQPYDFNSLSAMEDESSHLDHHQQRRSSHSSDRSRGKEYLHDFNREYSQGVNSERGMIYKEECSSKELTNASRSNIPRTGDKRVSYHRDNINDKRYDHKENTPRPITCSLLNTWAEMEEAGQLVLLMSSKHQQLQIFLKQNTVNEDWLIPLLDAVCHAITAQHQKESIKLLLDCLCNSMFFEHLTNYLTEKQISEVSWSKADDFFTSCIQILNEVLNKLPHYAKICLRTASSLMNAACYFKSINENRILIDAITVFSKKAKEVFLVEKEKEMRSRRRVFKSDNLEKPPDNFMDISVVPTEFDLHEDSNPFLRCAKIEGGYEDINHYLDVQFRLLRQDFILPLRKGIVEFKNNGCRKNCRSSDLRFYFDVHIRGIFCSDGVNHILQFNISSLKKVYWKISKRFMFGSLLCLSKDNFKSVLFATVANYDVENLAAGFVVVNFKTGLDEVFNSTSSDVFIMAETKAFFESYYHVLEGLQEMSTELPLQDYIIHCKTQITPPHYLLPSGGVCRLPIYDLKCLMKDNVKSKVAVLTTVKWPKDDKMCLNESQRAAAQLALTKELAIIQGPPGTGKTYVGLKVMQVLLENLHVIHVNEENSFGPILVVCYTNHALDQFLEGILEFCPNGIVRVGGQCKSEKLKTFNIKELKRLHSGRTWNESIKKCNQECNILSDQIYKLNQTLEFLQTDIISDEVLKEHMAEIHHNSLLLEIAQFNESKQPMCKWLQTSSYIAEIMIPKMIKQHLTMLILKHKDIYKNIKLTDKMDIIQRASYYHHYLKKYEHLLKALKMQPDKHTNVTKQEIDDLLRAAQTMILPDCELDQVLLPETLKKISSYLRSDLMGKTVYAGDVVEYWLLGLEKDLQSQLDDIEVLTNLGQQEKANLWTVYNDEDFNKEQNKRIVDVDSSCIGKLNRSLRAALNNLAYVKHRADTLGVRDNDFIDEDENDEKWKRINAKSLNTKAVQKKRLIEPMTEEKENSIINVWDLELDERFALYNLWVKRYRLTLIEKMKKLVNEYKLVQQRKREANSEETLYVFNKSKVIGMTTTGAAKHRSVLQAVGCRIIIVEEAAEVLESHIVTSLNKNCKHLILIGDHQQLRPNPNVYQLAKDYGLEISLFERLLKNKVPHVMLNEQHRMRPEISKMMRHIYPDLQDHISVEDYENICGVAKNIFLIQHEHKELHMDESMSKSNTHEAKYLVALCQYLLNQDYEASQITILATYSGQVLEIKNTMKMLNFEHKVLVTAVDNFQGEENDIILLSLVRSNTDNLVGFLKVDNRVCVALSRAKMGLYVIGNFNLLASQSKLWKKITETANMENVIGLGLPVLCQNHPDLKELMISDKDFQKRPEGGCGLPCKYKLQCGHVCGLLCHGYDPEHTKYKCQKPCLNKCGMGHPCKLKCYQDCEDCKEIVTKYLPFCGHDDKVPCCIPETEAVCSQRCSVILECNHQCSGRCGICKEYEKHDRCLVPVPDLWPCGHTNKVPCYMDPSIYPCPKVCGEKLQCGHNCIGKCTECLEGAIHAACGERCVKLLPCGHICSSFCSVPCLPCNKSCPGQCHHTACFKISPTPLCGHACQPCRNKCSYNCKHSKCGKLCFENCDIEPCKKKCHKNVQPCNHKCSGFCGELCVCGKCNKVFEIPGKSEKSETAEDNYGGEERESRNELPVVTDTTIKLKASANKIGEQKRESERKRLLIKMSTCGHIFYVDELDKYVNDFDPNGSRYILCPICPQPILKCARYENINKVRNRKREMQKETLKKTSCLSAKHRADLITSKKRLEKCSLLSEFHTFPVTEVSNQVELQVMSFQFKCAFMLNAISSVMMNNKDPSSITLLKSRKSAVLELIKSRLTIQKKSEFIKELSRSFWLSYLSHLENVSIQDVPLNCEIDAEVNTIIEALSKPNPSNESLLRAELVSHKKNRRILEQLEIDQLRSSSHFPVEHKYNLRFQPRVANVRASKAKLLFLEQTSVQAMRILKSRDDEMLCDLIKGDKDEDLLHTPIKAESQFAGKNKVQENWDKHSRDQLKQPTLSKMATPFHRRARTKLSSQARSLSSDAGGQRSENRRQSRKQEKQLYME